MSWRRCDPILDWKVRRQSISAQELQVFSVTLDRWKDMADLFERKGPRAGTPPTAWCWCMWWRERSYDRAKNRGAMSRIVHAGREPGLLAYESGKPVGWISVAPRSDFKQLDRSPTLKPQDPEEEGIYSIVCFYVHPTARRRGVAEALLRAAVDHVRVLGGKIVEAYPSEQLKTTMEFMGESKLFLRNGFEVVRRARSRLVMRYVIGQ